METADNRAEKILRFEALRTQLAGQFPHPRAEPGEALASGCAAIDRAVGGLRRGAINEFSGTTGSGPLLLGMLLEQALRDGWHLALVDGGDSFDPSQWAGPLLRRMLWVRCRDARQAIRATDLLLRDGNLPLVVLDVQGVPADALRRIPSSTWHRFQRILESAATSLLVLSERPIAEGARLRIHCDSSWELDALEQPRAELAAGMRLAVRERAGMEMRRTA
ncbi:MAG: hypothetical protein PHC88_06710 [Terrimicrobiaceae bacterium]|nr:hypothetical protein [Terrimicrobiaceae bacterium]